MHTFFPEKAAKVRAFYYYCVRCQMFFQLTKLSIAYFIFFVNKNTQKSGEIVYFDKSGLEKYT